MTPWRPLAGVMLVAAVAAATPPLALGDGQAVVEPFGGELAAGWTRAAESTVPAAAWSSQPVWYGTRVTFLGPGELVLTRPYGMALTGYRQLVLRADPAGGTRVSLGATVDGRALPPVAVGDRGEAALLVAGARLDAVTITIVGDPPGKRVKAGDDVHKADLYWLVARERERLEVTAYGFSNRAVLLAWRRPAWGAERYYVARSREPIGEVDRTPAIAAGRSGQTPFLVDTPPTGGDWSYGIAPIEPGGLGLPVKLTTAVPDRPVPSLPYASFPLTIDGDLADWKPAERGIVSLTPDTGFVLGEPVQGPSDLSAVIHLAHDSTALYLAADVTDNEVAHRSEAVSAGDGVVLMLGAVHPVNGHWDRSYALVVAYGAATHAPARLLREGPRTYTDETAPPAPGTWAFKPTDHGYVLEARLPLTALRPLGLDLDTDDVLALGLSLNDSDDRLGPTHRRTTLSWSQRHDPYAGDEAGLARVEHYP